MSSHLTHRPVRSGSGTSIALWAGRIAIALLFLATGSAKLYGVPDMVKGFDAIGFGQWFRYFTGTLELTGAVLLVWPALSPLGALIVIGIATGAFIAQLTVMHGDVIHTLVLLAIGTGLLWAQRNAFKTLLGLAPAGTGSA